MKRGWRPVPAALRRGATTAENAWTKKRTAIAVHAADIDGRGLSAFALRTTRSGVAE
jgi:hypothetical protein